MGILEGERNFQAVRGVIDKASRELIQRNKLCGIGLSFILESFRS